MCGLLAVVCGFSDDFNVLVVSFAFVGWGTCFLCLCLLLNCGWLRRFVLLFFLG